YLRARGLDLTQHVERRIGPRSIERWQRRIDVARPEQPAGSPEVAYGQRCASIQLLFRRHALLKGVRNPYVRIEPDHACGLRGRSAAHKRIRICGIRNKEAPQAFAIIREQSEDAERTGPSVQKSGSTPDDRRRP